MGRIPSNSLRPKIYCRREKKRAHHKYKENIAMTDCLQAGYSITRQSVIAIIILCVFRVSWVFCACSQGLVYLGSYPLATTLLFKEVTDSSDTWAFNETEETIFFSLFSTIERSEA